MPSERNTSSNPAVNLLSRSWIKNLKDRSDLEVGLVEGGCARATNGAKITEGAVARPGGTTSGAKSIACPRSSAWDTVSRPPTPASNASAPAERILTRDAMAE
jgi:hypothetical protein